MHKYIIVTSNYSINELWPDRLDKNGNVDEDNEVLRSAISRRFQEFRVNNRLEVAQLAEEIDTDNLIWLI